MSKKIKILVLPSDRSGVGKFRSIDPHVCLQKLYPNEVHVDIEFDVNYDDLSFWSKYDIIHYHRLIGQDYDNKKLELIRNYGYNLEVVWEDSLKNNNKLIENISSKYAKKSNSTP